MDKLTKVEFIKQFNELLRTTDECSNISIKYGYDDNGKFIESDRDLTAPTDPREYIQIKYDNTDDGMSVLQSVEMDNCFSALKDIMEGLNTLIRTYR